MKKLALVMPAYNEGTVIASVLKSLPDNYGDIAVEKVVIDDGSTDNTASQAAATDATVIRHVLNSGSGGATDTGLEYARIHGFDYAVTIDADGQHTAADCKKVVTKLLEDKHDIVIGSRLIDSSGMPWFRVVGNRGLSFITLLMFGIGVSDSQSGLKGFSRQALEKIEIRSSGMEFCSEIIWRAGQQKLTITEVPIRAVYTDYSLKKGQSNWNAFSIIMNLVKRKLLELVNA